MNESRRPCESRLEDISLLAAGCLAPSEEIQLRDHFALCAGCRERFEEVATICVHLRATQPDVDADSHRAIERSLQNMPSQPRSRLWRVRSAGFSIAILTACVLVVVGLLSRYTRSRVVEVPRQKMEIARETRPAAEPHPTRLPTMLALRRAATESDESFNRLLDQYSQSSLSHGVDTQPLWKENLQ